MRFKHFSALAAVALAIGVVGCGGGGGSKGGSSSARANVGVFLTDDLGAYDHVWVTVKKIVLTGPSGAQTVYDDATGQTIDLATLHNGTTATFAFLGIGKIPEGVYSGIAVTMDANLVLFPAGAATGLPRTFAGAANGTKTLSVAVEGAGEDIRGDDDLVIDFDLSQWTDDGTTVTATARRRDGEGLDDPTRHHDEDYGGTIFGVSADGFTLTPRHGEPIAVTIDANTVVFGDATTLANGQRVQVRGTFATATRTLAATSVKVENGNGNGNGNGGGGHDDRAEVRGGVTAVGTESFDLSTGDCDGFLPTSATVHVVYGPTTRFQGDRGATLSESAFAAALAVGGHAEAEGAYDSATGTLTATKIKLENEGEGGTGGGGDTTGGHGGGDDGGGHG